MRILFATILLAIGVVAGFFYYVEKQQEKYVIDVEYRSVGTYSDDNGKFALITCEKTFMELKFNIDTLILINHDRDLVVGFKPLYFENDNTLMTCRAKNGSQIKFGKVKITDSGTDLLYFSFGAFVVVFSSDNDCFKFPEKK